MKSKFQLTPKVLSEFIENQRRDIAFITLHLDSNTGIISTEIGVRIPGSNKINKIPVSNQIFVKPSPENLHLPSVVNGRKSGKKRFYQFGNKGTDFTYVKRKKRIHIGTKEEKEITVNEYVGMKEQFITGTRETLAIEIQGITPERFIKDNCVYFLYKVKNYDGTITEVYCSKNNPQLVRFVKYPGENHFTYIS